MVSCLLLVRSLAFHSCSSPYKLTESFIYGKLSIFRTKGLRTIPNSPKQRITQCFAEDGMFGPQDLEILESNLRLQHQCQRPLEGSKARLPIL